MKIKFTVTLLFMLYAGKMVAQSSECAVDFVHRYLMERDTAYKNQLISLESNVQAILQRKNEKPQSVVYTIPVVVHVIHLGEALGVGTNIPDVQIQGAISALNDRWRNVIGTGVDVEIEFCLATQDTNGNVTTGINRVDGSSVANYATQGISLGGCGFGAVQNDVKSLSRWPVSDYYNIWVVNKICNGQWGGWTYYPNGGMNDGATIISTLMTSASTLLTHEVGHGFFAYHTFEGDGGNLICPIDTNCAVNGDHVCDTPPHKQNDCGLTNPCTTGGVWTNARYNYMSYCSNLTRFTQEQKDRMRAVAILPPRASLLTSLGCTPIVNVTDLDNLERIFTVIPNPSNGNFTIEVKQEFANFNLEILNLLGEKIYFREIKNLLSTSTERIQLNASAGIYLIKINNSGKQLIKKIIIQ